MTPHYVRPLPLQLTGPLRASSTGNRKRKKKSHKPHLHLIWLSFMVDSWPSELLLGDHLDKPSDWHLNLCITFYLSPWKNPNSFSRSKTRDIFTSRYFWNLSSLHFTGQRTNTLNQERKEARLKKVQKVFICAWRQHFWILLSSTLCLFYIFYKHWNVMLLLFIPTFQTKWVMWTPCNLNQDKTSYFGTSLGHTGIKTLIYTLDVYIKLWLFNICPLLKYVRGKWEVSTKPLGWSTS